jgi:hypothetical protein
MLGARSRLGSAAFVVSLAASSIAAAQTPAPIRLKSRTFVPAANVHAAGGARMPGPWARTPSAGTPQSRSAGGAGGVGEEAPTHLLIQFAGAITAADLSALRMAGAFPLRYVPEHTVAVAAAPGFDPSRLARVRWVGELASSDKISMDSARDLSLDSPRYPLTAIEFHPDLTRGAVAARLSAAGVASVPAAHLPAHVALVATDRTAIEILAADDGVAWVYPATSDVVAAAAIVCEGLVSPQGVVANYATVGDGWDGPGNGSAELSYFLSAGSADLSASLQIGEIARALAEWSRYADVRWQPAEGAGLPHSLTILWGPPDHGDGFRFAPEVLAHAFYPAPPAPEPIGGDIHFNDTFDWGAGDPARYDVFTVALHESGHSLGLAHSSNPSSVMYPMYRGIVSGAGEEDVAAIQSLYALPGMPAGWREMAIGSAIAGGAIEHDGVFTISASGRDVWDAADDFRFVSRTLRGDGDVIARVDSLEAVHRWSKAGVMIRAGESPGAPHAFMLVSGAKGLAFQRRTTPDGLSTSTDGGAGTAPQWLWLSRRGNRFEAYAAVDGGWWRLVGTETIAMGTDVLAGIAVTSHDVAAIATAAFSSVSIASAAVWTGTDIGAVGIAGSWTAAAGQIRVLGAGADVWAAADAFQFVWQPLSGDGEIVARVASVEYTRAWTKAGVMIRESLDPGSPHAFMIVSAGKGYAFQRRVASGGLSDHTTGGAGTAPHYVKLTRSGDLLSAFGSADGVTWTLVGSEIIPMGREVMAGLAVSSHTTTAASQAVFDTVRMR